MPRSGTIRRAHCSLPRSAWTYGAILLMHLASTLASHARMIPPYGPGASKTFWAAVPVLAGIATLFILRNRDRLFSVSEWRK